MKKILLISITLISFSFNGMCWTKIEKENGGFFGYKIVTETTAGPNMQLSCYGPGRNKCRFSQKGFTVVGEDNKIIQHNDYSAIEEQVMRLMTSENTSGSFTHARDLFVTYSYDIDKDRLTMEIYSIYEAKALKLL